MTIEFDIKAPIENQFTRGGKKVLMVLHTSADIKYPIAALIEGDQAVSAFLPNGQFDSSGVGRHDLITRGLIVPHEPANNPIVVRDYQQKAISYLYAHPGTAIYNVSP